MLRYNTHELLDIDDDPTSNSDESGDVSGRTDHLSPGLYVVHTTPRRYGYLGVLNRTNTECVPGPRNVVETNLAAVIFFVLSLYQYSGRSDRTLPPGALMYLFQGKRRKAPLKFVFRIQQKVGRIKL